MNDKHNFLYDYNINFKQQIELVEIAFNMNRCRLASRIQYIV